MLCRIIYSRTLKIILPKLLLLTTVILGCTFQPEEEFFKDVKEVTPSAFIDLTDYNEEDTILLIQPTTFKYNVAITAPATLEELQIVLNSNEIIESHTASGQFSLSQTFIPLGIHQLTIQFRAKSNSGSLADNVGAEYFQVWKRWVLKVVRFDNDPPTAPGVSITEKDGFLRLDWTPYTKINFISYKLKVAYPYQHEVVFDDPLSTYWVDSSFLWGQASYEVTVTNPYGSASTNVSINEPQEFSVTYNANDSTALLKWKPSKFYKAFGSVVITENQTLRQTITSASDSTLILKLNEVLWGRSESVMLQVFPKNKQLEHYESREFLYDIVPLLRGRPELYYQDGIKKVIGHSSSMSLVYFYDDLLNVTDSVSVYTSLLAVPYSGNYVFYVNNNMTVRWNLATNEKVFSNDLPNFVIEPTSIHGSSNGFVSYYSLNHQYPWDIRMSLSIQNTDDKTFIEKTDTNYDPKITLPPKSRVLSDDGRFFLDVYRRRIYKAESGIPSVGSLPLTGSFFCFRRDNNNEILLRGIGSLSIINSIDLSTLRTITLPSGFTVESYDPVTHYVVCSKTDANVVYLVNIDTNHSKTVAAYSTQWKLINGYLINFAGQYLKVL